LKSVQSGSRSRPDNSLAGFFLGGAREIAHRRGKTKMARGAIADREDSGKPLAGVSGSPKAIPPGHKISGIQKAFWVLFLLCERLGFSPYGIADCQRHERIGSK